MEQGWYFIIGIIIGALVVWFWVGRGLKSRGDSKLIEMKRKQKQETKKNILAMLENKQRISNNEVEQALKIPNSTVERHLDELEHEGVLRQVGKIGRDVYYEKI